MNKLRDDHLIDVYLQALEMELDEDFINLLHSEIKKRKLKVDFEPVNLLHL